MKFCELKLKSLTIFHAIYFISFGLEKGFWGDTYMYPLARDVIISDCIYKGGMLC